MGACVAGTTCQSVAGVPQCQPSPYVESTAPASEYVDACAVGRAEVFSGLDVNLNRTALPLTLPFPFSYYGTARTVFWPGTGAWGVFAPTRPGTQVASLSDNDVVSSALVPFQVVADGGESVWLRASGSRICSATVGTAPNRRFVVEWNDFTIGRDYPAVHLTFEAVLHESTNAIDFLYRRLEPATGVGSAYTDGLLADVGLVGGAGQVATVHRGPVSTAEGIRFTPR